MFSQRLKNERMRLGLNQTDFAEACGVKLRAQANYEKGERTPDSDYLQKAYALGVDTHYLLSGQRLNNVGASEAVGDSPDSDYEQIPFYRAEASAGSGSFTDGHRKPTHHLAFRKRWINAKGFHLKDLVGLVVSGDSMEPTIHDGAAIIINTAHNEAMDGNIYVIRMSDRLWVKRTQWLPNGGLRLISDNELYDSLDFSAKDLEHDDIEVIGQVVHTAYDLVK